MNILIIGLGNAGKYYLNILKLYFKKNKIFIVDEIKHPKSLYYKQIEFSVEQLKKNKIDYAIISTPSGSHYEYARVLIQNSINTLIEKPFVLNLFESEKLIANTKKKKIKCWVVFQNRYNLAIKKIIEIIKKKTLGKIFLADCSLIWSRNKKYYKIPWRGKYSSDGGVLTNQAIHLLDATIFIFGKVKKFTSILGFNKKKLEAEDLASLSLLHENKIITNFKATTRADQNYKSSMDVIGEKGRVIVEGVSLNILNYFTGNKVKRDKNNSEKFSETKGVFGGMGNGHLKILGEFLNKNIKKSSQGLEIQKNQHVLKLLHSIYNNSKIEKLHNVSNKESRLGKK